MSDLSKVSDAKLDALAAHLAEQRTKVRLAQNAVAAELDVRRAIKAMPAESRRIVQIRLAGGVDPSGEAAAPKE